jgi:predicted AAA+ superfamily ATPase
MLNRNILNKLEDEITRPEVIVLLGPRQVGKTTILKMLQAKVQKAHKHTAFFDLEQPATLAEFNRSDTALVEYLRTAGDILFIDEFQYVGNISKIFKAIFDSGKKIKIFCSGSSAPEIHTHLKESLAGRRFLYRVYPLEFSELTAGIAHFKLDDYLIFGGMPGLLSADSSARKIQILNEILSAYILKDIKSLVKEENIKAFNHLLYLLAQNQGALISVNSLSNEIGLSAKAASRYLDILEQTYVNFRVYSFSENLGNELKKSCKTYLFDLGVRNALLKDFSAIDDRTDKGNILETASFLKLQAGLSPNEEIKFWRTKDGAEVDFVLVKNRRPIPIEVKSNLPGRAVPSGLRRFLDRYPRTKNAYVVSEKVDGDIIVDGCRVVFVTLQKFLTNFIISD